MRIKAIEPIAISLPMKKPVKMAGETVTRADNILVRIETDDGGVGWGEAASAPTMTGETVASMMAAVLHMAPGLLKRPADDIASAAAAMDFRCTATAAPRRRSRSRCTISSAAPRAFRCTRSSAASAATAFHCSRSSAPTMPRPICARRSNAAMPAMSSTRSKSASRRRKPTPRARGIFAACSARTASFRPTPIRVLTPMKASVMCVRSPIAA